VSATHAGHTPVTYPNIIISAEQTRLLPITFTCEFVDDASFSYASAEPWTQIPVVFTGNTLTGTEPMTYTWNFGHEADVYLGNPITHTFPKATTSLWPYSVTMTVTNACSQQTVQEWVSTRTQLNPCQSIAGLAFDYVPCTVMMQEHVQFMATIMTGTQPITYTWNFGTGAGLWVGNPITHTFPTHTSSMPYRVTVTATNACSQQTVERRIIVHPHRIYLPVILHQPHTR
jgi:PKD repeat protein